MLSKQQDTSANEKKEISEQCKDINKKCDTIISKIKKKQKKKCIGETYNE